MFTIQPGRETVTKTFRLPVNMAAELEQLAADNNLSLNNVVVQCLTYALADLEINTVRKEEKSVG